MNAIIDTLARTWRETVKTFKLLARNKMGMFGFTMTLLIVFLSFFGPLIWSPEQSANVAEINQGISGKHWLGTDFQGQDNLRKIINGGKDIVTVAFLTGITATFFGVIVGAFSAFVGGNIDSVLMELVNIWLTIPKLPLLAVAATVIKLNDPIALSLLIAFLDWPSLARSAVKCCHSKSAITSKPRRCSTWERATLS
jgi:ABC-type dipeptide/oligopeptide/nickel transport system permease subunit